MQYSSADKARLITTPVSTVTPRRDFFTKLSDGTYQAPVTPKPVALLSISKQAADAA